MAVSSSVGRTFTVDQIVTRAFRFAGLAEASQTPREEELVFGRDLLEDILDRLETEGFFARFIEFYDLSLEADVARYDLPGQYLDVVNPAMHIADGEDPDAASSETLVEVISREEWQRYSSKAAGGLPHKVYAHRTSDQVQLRFWPIPSAAGTVRLQVQRKLADVDSGEATIDLQPYWTDYLKTALAGDLAEAYSMPADKVMRLASRAAGLMRKMKGKANQSVDNRIHVSHRTGWRNR